jgi:TolA-binding protein
MKRTERRHLKTNELASLAARARDVVDARRGQVVAGLVAVVVVAGAIIGYVAWRGREQSRAYALLAQALVIEEVRVGPPAAPGTPSSGASFATQREKSQAVLTKFKAAADGYPSTDAGVFARYREATTWMALGNPASAATAYQEVVNRGGSSVYAVMARLGLAEAQAQSGQYDQAISTFKELAQRKDGQVPVDGVLIRLGRAYLDAGKRADAEQTFNRLVQEFPDSPFSSDARRALEQLKRT